MSMSMNPASINFSPSSQAASDSESLNAPDAACGPHIGPTPLKVSSLKEFATIASELCSGPTPFWFRGTRHATKHDLRPSLYRHPSFNTAEKFRELEKRLMGTFLDRSPPFQKDIPTEPIELLFFMQHHGAPTRLLDWTENPFIALFFALEVALWEEEDRAVDSAVWVLSPKELNMTTFNNNDGADTIISPRDDLVNAYRPNSSVQTSGRSPIAIHGVHNSQRIVAQRGVFVLFGSNTICMSRDTQVSAKPDVLYPILIDRSAKKSIAKSLFNMGITDSVVYPDLDGLGREMKNHYEFWSK